MLPPEKPDEEAEEQETPRTKKINIHEFLVGDRERFGRPINTINEINILERVHYSGEWDILRPATEIEGVTAITLKDMAQLKTEAFSIMEGWRTEYE